MSGFGSEADAVNGPPLRSQSYRARMLMTMDLAFAQAGTGVSGLVEAA